MDLGLKGKNALLTGGSQGVGFAIARALAEEGCNVAIGARGRARLDQAVGSLSKLGIKAVPIAVDLTTEEGCRTFVDGAVADLRRCRRRLLRRKTRTGLCHLRRRLNRSACRFWRTP